MKRVLLSITILILLGLGISDYSLIHPQTSPAKPVVTVLVIPQPICSTWELGNNTVTLSNNSQSIPFTFHACLGDIGQRFKFTITAIEQTGPHPGQNQTATIYVTVPGKCNFFTADVNTDWKVNLGDLAAMSLTFGKPLTKNKATDVNGDGRIDILDFACSAFYYGKSEAPF